jgi:hypothetical protein
MAPERTDATFAKLPSVAQRQPPSLRIGRKCRSCAEAMTGDFFVLDLLTEVCSGREVRP